MPTTTIPPACAHCGDSLADKRRGTKFCSKSCRAKAAYAASEEHKEAKKRQEQRRKVRLETTPKLTQLKSMARHRKRLWAKEKARLDEERAADHAEEPQPQHFPRIADYTKAMEEYRRRCRERWEEQEREHQEWLASFPSRSTGSGHPDGFVPLEERLLSEPDEDPDDMTPAERVQYFDEAKGFMRGDDPFYPRKRRERRF